MRCIHGGELEDPEDFERLMARLAKARWVLYAKRPFGSIEQVLGYLGRCTHRVAISNGRLVDVRESSVTFRTKEWKTHALTSVEFLRRFIQHVLPGGFHKRSSSAKRSKLDQGTRQLPRNYSRQFILTSTSVGMPVPRRRQQSALC